MEIPAVYLSRTLSHLLSAHEQYIYIYAEMSSISLKLWNMFEDPMLYATLCSWGIETGWEVTLISLNIIILLSHVLSQKKHKHLQWKGEGTDIWKRPWPTSVGWTNITRLSSVASLHIVEICCAGLVCHSAQIHWSLRSTTTERLSWSSCELNVTSAFLCSLSIHDWLIGTATNGGNWVGMLNRSSLLRYFELHCMLEWVPL